MAVIYKVELKERKFGSVILTLAEQHGEERVSCTSACTSKHYYNLIPRDL